MRFKSFGQNCSTFQKGRAALSVQQSPKAIPPERMLLQEPVSAPLDEELTRHRATSPGPGEPFLGLKRNAGSGPLFAFFRCGIFIIGGCRHAECESRVWADGFFRTGAPSGVRCGRSCRADGALVRCDAHPSGRTRRENRRCRHHRPQRFRRQSRQANRPRRSHPLPATDQHRRRKRCKDCVYRR